MFSGGQFEFQMKQVLKTTIIKSTQGILCMAYVRIF